MSTNHNDQTIADTNGVINGSLNHSKHDQNEDETYAYAAQILNSCVLPMILNATIDLGVLQIINKEVDSDGLSTTELATRIQSKNPEAPVMLDRMLRVLATYSVVSCKAITNEEGSVLRLYGPAPVTKFFVPDEDGVSLAPMLNLVIDKVFLSTWCKLKEAVMEGGIPFNKVYGMHAFEYPSVDPKFNEIFNKAMLAHSTHTIKKVIQNYKGFENIKQLVDVGGGLGHSINAITSQYPSIKGINFDLPHVIQQAPPLPGVEHVGGDMFESVPKGDAIFMKWILHDWSDDQCLVLLKNCYKALPEDGKVIVVETNITDEPETTSLSRAISQLDVSMMTQNPGGKERTRREFEALAKAAGFSGVKIHCYVCNFWVMEFHK
ncbi:cathecol O-methyltransferase 1-like [Amaranthus tricolor]|uniref:cathecol O-methyltransferase 1-like n=1 Tax=Amaranthus tricolor TaxID=29722 RepID=UPI002588C25F|nr:cathecol O-methyltransferase 1-like [Amaranthus tricolor]